MSRLVRGIAGVGSAALGIASLFPGPWQPFLAGGSIALGLFGRGGAGKKGSNQFEQLQQLAQLLQRPPPLSQTVNSTAAARILAYGRISNAGVSIVKETTPDRANYLEAIYLNEGPIDGLDALIIDDEFTPLTNSYSGVIYDYFWPTAGRKFGGGYPNSSYVLVELANGVAAGKWSKLYRGNPGAAAGTIDPNWNPFWEGTHLGKGCTILYTASFKTVSPGDRLTVYPNGFPTFKVIYRAARVYDPRDYGQRFSQDSFSVHSPDPSWKWSENPALCAAHYVSYLISQNLTAIRGVNWEWIMEAADDCDRLAPKRLNGFNGGVISYEPFARVSAKIQLDEEPRNVLAKFLESCDGEWGVDENGLFVMWINKFEEPSVIFTGADISDYVEDFGPGMNEEVNYAHSTYVDARQGFNRVETPIYRDLKSEGEIGRRTGACSYDWVTSPDQAYRLTARKVKQANARKRLSVTLGPRAMTALKQVVVGLDAPEYFLSGAWRIEDLRPVDATLSKWSAELIEIAEDAYVDAVIPEDPIYGLALVNQPAIATPTYLIAAAISTRSGFGAAQLSLDVNRNYPDQNNPTINFAALLADPTLTLDGRWSMDGGTTWTNFAVLLSAMIMQTPELTRGTVVTMQARFVAASGAVGSYSSSVTATIP